MANEAEVCVYTDGSCLTNPGPGGWAFLVIDGENEVACSGGECKTTNNRMELRAVIEALHYFQATPVKIHLFTDSLLVLNCAQRLWKRKANLDLWEEFDKVSASLQLVWTWVKGHNGNHYNEVVDKLAKRKAELYSALK